MIVMPSNSTGWFWHALSRETGRLGHLYSPGAQRGPWPWFPFALDNGAFSAWTEKTNFFDEEKWAIIERRWHQLIVWTQVKPQKPLWAIVPDVPGNAERTLERWEQYVGQLGDIPPALAVQDGMTPATVRALRVQPAVIAVGGTKKWKWETVSTWAREFPRVHLLRCCSPERLYELEELGVESCDGTGWARGDRKQTRGLENFVRIHAKPVDFPLWPHNCRQPRKSERGPLGEQQESFA